MSKQRQALNQALKTQNNRIEVLHNDNKVTSNLRKTFITKTMPHQFGNAYKTEHEQCPIFNHALIVLSNK